MGVSFTRRLSLHLGILDYKWFYLSPLIFSVSAEKLVVNQTVTCLSFIVCNCSLVYLDMNWLLIIPPVLLSSSNEQITFLGFACNPVFSPLLLGSINHITAIQVTFTSHTLPSAPTPTPHINSAAALCLVSSDIF